MWRRLACLLKAFNTSPRFQFAFQATGTVVSAALFVAIPLLYISSYSLWLRISWLTLILITDWGNFVTDYQGCAAAEASGHSAALGHNRVNLHHRGLARLLERIGVDPRFQYRMHLGLTYNWGVQAVAAVVLFAVAPGFFSHYDALYCVIQNNYTNFGTGLSALPDTRAAMHLSTLRRGRSPWDPEPEDVL